jgi:hypothetical protein
MVVSVTQILLCIVVLFSVVEPTLSVVESNDVEMIEVCLTLLSPLVEFLRTEIYIDVNSK